jgi:anthranilate phosphoribosyltransferase
VLKDGEVSNCTVAPNDFGLEVHSLESVKGGDPQVNLEILKDLLNNKPGPYLDWVVMNTAALLVVNQRAEDYINGVDLARHAISSGKARHVLEQFTMMSASFHHKKHKSH